MMEGEDSQSDDDRSFQKKSVWARISVVAAGPIFNFIMAFVLAVIILGNIGISTPTVAQVEDGYGAQTAGLQAGDEIIKMNHKHIHFSRKSVCIHCFMPVRLWKLLMREMVTPYRRSAADL